MIQLDAFLFDNLLFYGIFETIIVVIAIYFELQLVKSWRKTKSPTLKLLIGYFIFNILAIIFSASMKFVWYFYEGDFPNTFLFYLFDRGYFIYISTILANIFFSFYARRIFSHTKSKFKIFLLVYSILLIPLGFFKEINDILLKIFLLGHSITVYLPVMFESYKWKKKIRNETRAIMVTLFKFSLVLNLVWISSVLDGLWDLFDGKSFGLFYYSIWLCTITAIFIAYRGNIKSPRLGQSFNHPNISLTDQKTESSSSSLEDMGFQTRNKMILISCPICHKATFYSISPQILELCRQEASGMVSIYIQRNLTCQHSYLVYVDKMLNVRRYEMLEYNTDPDIILQHLPDLFFHVKSDTTILDVLGDKSRLFVPKENLIGKKITDILPKDVAQQSKEAIQTARKENRVTTIQYELKIPSGYQTFEARNIPTSSNTVLSVIQDISERKEAEEELLNERLRSEKSSSISLLAGGIAHDFNNILVSIMGNVSLLQLDDTLSDENVECLKDLENATKRARDLTEQLLTFSKKDAKHIIKEPTDATAILRNSISLIMRGSRSICKTKFIADSPLVFGNPGHLSQVFNNILINANQAMPNGGTITVLTEKIGIDSIEGLKIPPEKSQNYMHIAFTDTGSGIPQDHQLHIFEPYYTTKKHGSGLGLASSYSIIENHDGYMTFESVEEKGTTFHIYLPIPS
ncbi:MAG: ATP-binding protein [Promethearchaeota archaeon]